MSLDNIHLQELAPVGTDLAVDTDSTFLDKLPFRKTVATAMAAVAFAGAAKAEAAIEGYSQSTPAGAVMEWADLFSRGDYKDSCKIDHYRCRYTTFNHITPAMKAIYKKVYKPISAKVVPIPPSLENMDQTRGGTMVELHTATYDKTHMPYCAVVKKYGNEWEMVFQGFAKAGSVCSHPKI